jgi:hypothetical protein
MNLTRAERFLFRGAMAPPAVASRLDIWCSKTVLTAGTPTVKSVNGGTMDLALDATNEVQNACLYFGDILSFKIQDLQRVWITAKLGTMAAGLTASFGVIAARNDAPTSAAAYAFFQVTGNSQALIAHAYDGVIADPAAAVGLNLGNTLQRFCIDFTGVQSKQLPAPSLGNRSAVTFFAEDSNGALQQVCKSTLFDMSNYAGTSGLQLFAQMQKTATAALATLSIESFEVEFKAR